MVHKDPDNAIELGPDQLVVIRSATKNIFGQHEVTTHLNEADLKHIVNDSMFMCEVVADLIDALAGRESEQGRKMLKMISTMLLSSYAAREKSNGDRGPLH